MPPRSGPPPAVFSPTSSTTTTTRKAPRDVAPGSPGYFGLTVDASNAAVTSSGARMVAKSGMSSSNVSVRSAAASPPQSLPFHSSPEFDAFRNAADHGNFDLNRVSVPKFSASTDQTRSRPSLDRKHSKQDPSTPKSKHLSMPPHIKADVLSPKDCLASSRSPNKRLLSSDSTGILDRPRKESPASFTEEDHARAAGSPPSKHEEKHPRLRESNNGKLVASGLINHGADTLPEKFATGGNPTMVTPQYVVNILDSQVDEVLLLDLRVSTQYARSRILTALNLCVPTTLLKRSTYNVAKLADTFRDESQKSKFEKWKTCKSIIVYDGNCTQMKEAANCLNVLKKFASEGWEGNSYVLKGGFFDFLRKFPQYLEHGDETASASKPTALTIQTDEETVAPVIGGCPMPASATKTAANPFFGNIRQNMDLIGGVGQIQIQIPSSARQRPRSDIPFWLRNAIDESDGGKGVADKFLQIEKREQKRMQEALSGNVTYDSSPSGCGRTIQIAGIEKGSKNRYNNIWPFEHSRVKLQGVPAHGCDYVNANFIQSSLSNKKFIATQGPIPSTFTDFWNMVWQRDIRVIVMLTAEFEGGQVKAHNYWSDKSYGPLRLRYLSEHRASLELSKIRSHRDRPSLDKSRTSQPSSSSSYSNESRHSSSASKEDSPGNLLSPSSATEQPYVRVRKFALSHEGEPFERMREITHLHYASWPDFGTPAHPAHLLGLVEQCDAVVRSNTSTTRTDAAPQNQRPVLVHCSAGCGRTGTFCTVDTVIDTLKAQMNFERNKQRAAAQQQSSKMDIDSSSSAAPSGLDDSWIGRDDIDFIEKTVEEFRVQRLSMVQSLRQFVLCYETIVEWMLGQDAHTLLKA